MYKYTHVAVCTYCRVQSEHCPCMQPKGGILLSIALVYVHVYTLYVCYHIHPILPYRAERAMESPGPSLLGNQVEGSAVSMTTSGLKKVDGNKMKWPPGTMGYHPIVLNGKYMSFACTCISSPTQEKFFILDVLWTLLTTTTATVVYWQKRILRIG